jgi:hypothetical protein
MMSVQYIVRRGADASTITRLAVSHGRVRGIRKARVNCRRLRVAREDKGYMDVGCCVDSTLHDTTRDEGAEHVSTHTHLGSTMERCHDLGGKR